MTQESPGVVCRVVVAVAVGRRGGTGRVAQTRWIGLKPGIKPRFLVGRQANGFRLSILGENNNNKKVLQGEGWSFNLLVPRNEKRLGIRQNRKGQKKASAV